MSAENKINAEYHSAVSSAVEELCTKNSGDAAEQPLHSLTGKMTGLLKPEINQDEL